MTDPDRADTALDKLLAAIDNKSVTIFDEKEVLALREVIKIWNGFKALGWLTDSLVRVLKWAAGISALWIALKHGSLEQLLKALK